MKKKWALHLAPVLLLAGAEAWAQGVLDEGDVPSGVDRDFQASVTSIRASWVVGMAPYEWAIGTTPGGEDIQVLTGVGITGQSAERLGLALTPGAIYYVTVRDMKVTLFYSDGITVGVGSPTATPAVGVAPLSVSFRQSALAGVLLYEWDFDVGAAWIPDLSSPASGDATFVYTLPGTRTAELRMHHAGGEVLTQSVQVQVAAPPGAPVVSLATSPTPPSGLVPLTVTFTASAQTSDGTVTVYLWDFDGDGVPDASSETPAITHTFRATGAVQAGVTVVDAAGNTAARTVTVTGTGLQAGLSLPTLTLTGVPTFPVQTGEVAGITAQGNSGGADDLVALLWDFNADGVTDRITSFATGTPSATVTETWQYEGPGSPSARVTVIDADGLSASASSVVDVLLEPAAKRCWILQPAPGAALFGDRVSLLATAVPAASVTGIEFKVRPAGASPFPAPGDSSWTSIGTALADFEIVFGLPWDVSTLPAGNYDLIAVATFADGTTDVSSSAVREITVAVSASEAGADVAEYSGSPFTSLLLSKIDPSLTSHAAIQKDILVRVPPGSVPSYAQMRIERRGDNPHPVEARLQKLKFLPNHFRRVGLSGAPGLGKPSRAVLYLGQTTGTTLADGTDLTRASFKVCRFDTGRNRWEPLPDQVTQPRQGLLQASLAVPGDLGVAVFLDRDETDSSRCGGPGVEVLLLLWVFFRRCRRGTPADGRD